MSEKLNEYLAHAYEAEPYPILHAWPELWWMPEQERNATIEARARMYGGQGYLPRKGGDREYER
jgi:hypothetical protein